MADAIAELNAALSDRYDVEREIGAGGMATVYLARDVRHHRKVAVKVVRPELGAILGGERFLSEIQVTASLQHPNLLPLFDSGEANGNLFYVMPYVDGETLRARMSREKQLPVDAAIRIASSVAGALDYAHRHGVIHRDLKPENILLHEGEPLIADFGIALAVSRAGGARITQTGLSLGTPQYMSPEQATGDRAIDGRTDIYSLGAVTYEMLTGEPPHSGATSHAIIAKLLTEDVRAITMLRRTVPPHVDGAVLRSLQKLPADRYATAHEFSEALQGRSTSAATRSFAAGASSDAKRWRGLVQRATWGLMAVAIVALSTALWGKRDAALLDRTTFVLNLGAKERFATKIGTPFALSPDGKSIAYVASRAGTPDRLYVRRFADLKATELAGTEGAWGPSFSPDGAWIAFVSGSELKKIAVGGGTAVSISRLSSLSLRGVTWVGDKLVAGYVNGHLLVAPATGGDTTRFVADSSAQGQSSARWPLGLPDGDHVVFASWGRGGLAGVTLWLASLSRRTARPLGVAGTVPLAMIGDQLVFVSRNGGLTSVGIDVEGMRTTSAESPLPERVSVDVVSAAAMAAMSREGSLAYQSGLTDLSLTLADTRSRDEAVIRPEARPYGFPRFSPDGRRIAMSIVDGSGGSDIWIFDRSAGTLQKLTEGELTARDRPEWTPDGRRVLFRSTDGDLRWQLADRSLGASTLQAGPKPGTTVNEAVVSPDGQWLVTRIGGGDIPQDIYYRRLTGDTTQRQFLATPWYETGPRFSPNGKWIAYSSDESSVSQVYVTPFPGPGPRYQVSLDGGDSPIWAPDGKRLFYAREPQILSANVTLSPAFAVGERKVVLEGSLALNYVHANYDVAPDGQHLLVLKRPVDAQTIVVRGWGSTLTSRAPSP